LLLSTHEVFVVVLVLSRAKALLDKASEHANRTKTYFERLVEIRALLLELKNYTDQSASKSRDAMNMNEINRRLLRTVLVSSSSQGRFKFQLKGRKGVWMTKDFSGVQ